jgi:hypothetical protein
VRLRSTYGRAENLTRIRYKFINTYIRTKRHRYTDETSVWKRLELPSTMKNLRWLVQHCCASLFLWERSSSQTVHHLTLLQSCSGDSFPRPSFSWFNNSGPFLLRGHTPFYCEVQNVNEWRERTVRAAVPDQKLNIVLMCVVPLMVTILRSAEHTGNSLCGRVVENVSIYPIHLVLQEIRVRIQKFPDLPPEAGIANDTALCH